MTISEKKDRLKQINRISARKSFLKKKMYLKNLEEENKTLKEKIELLEKQNKILTEKMKKKLEIKNDENKNIFKKSKLENSKDSIFYQENSNFHSTNNYNFALNL